MLMRIEPLRADIKRVATNIHKAAGRMRELLTEIGGARAEIWKMRQMIATAVEAAGAAARSNVAVAVEIPFEIEVRLIRPSMERVFFNLITNSFEAMPEGGEIRIRAREQGRWVFVEIEDTGPGIPYEIRDRIFQPFVTAGKANGLGLGLALSRRTVLEHGGEMWSEPAAGARFVIRLPSWDS